MQRVGAGLIGKERYLPWSVALLLFSTSIVLSVFFALLSPNIVTQLELNHSEIGILGGSSFLAYSLGQLLLGSKLGAISPRALLSLTALLASCGCIIFASSSNFLWALAGQILIAFGLSCSFIGVIYIIGRDLPDHFSLLSALSQGLANFSAASLSILLGLSANIASFRGPYYFAGVFLIALAAALYAIAGSNAEIRNKKNDSTLSLITQLRVCFTSLQFWAAFVFYACFYGSMLAYSDLWNVQFQVNFFDENAQQGTISNTMTLIGVIVGSLTVGVWAQHRNDYIIPARIFSLIALTITLILLLINLPISWSLGANFILGIGLSGSILAFSVIQTQLPKSTHTLATALVVTAGFIFGGILQAIVGLSLESNQQLGLIDRITEHLNFLPKGSAKFLTYQSAFQLVGIIICIGFFSSLFFNKKNSPCKDQ